MDRLQLFLQPLLPCYLAIFDLADTKRRNHYLGHLEVDKDILLFNDLLKIHLGEAAFRRISGDRWLACVTEEQIKCFNNLILGYAKEVPISAGWKCEASALNVTVLIIEEKSDILISRAVRCGYLPIQDTDEFVGKVNELLEKIPFLPVNSAISLEQEFTVNEPKWQCIIGNLPKNISKCPFCNGIEFDWLDGSDDTAYGICKSCNAKVDFIYCSKYW